MKRIAEQMPNWYKNFGEEKFSQKFDKLEARGRSVR